MNALVGWGLALAALAVGWWSYGWQGAVFAATLVVFWLLMQFSRALRVMKNAANRPKGRVGSAVMLNAKLQAGMTMMQVMGITRSLGERVSDSPDTWVWADEGASRVTLTFDKGRLSQWQLSRPA